MLGELSIKNEQFPYLQNNDSENKLSGSNITVVFCQNDFLFQLAYYFEPKKIEVKSNNKVQKTITSDLLQ